ncbi:MAG: hypothetical protein KF801_04970 [Cryobacterium sp.]|nr:hypothetical protein [Cryobacterium sp.]
MPLKISFLPTFGACLSLIVALALSGCTHSGPSVSGEPTQAASNPLGTASSTPPPSELPDASCDWESPRLPSGSDITPNGMGEDLAATIIGSWQHTHIDDGGGYEPVKPTTDIRYVFPSTTTMIYCQDVAGATSKADRTANIQLEGTEIVLPSPATGYDVLAWTHDIMVWKNLRDGSLYILKRR